MTGGMNGRKIGEGATWKCLETKIAKKSATHHWVMVMTSSLRNFAFLPRQLRKSLLFAVNTQVQVSDGARLRRERGLEPCSG